jgi:transposase-like protein
VISENVHKDSTIYTDEWKSYKGIGREFIGGHKTVNHGRNEYVNGDAYTNTAESFFSLLKRGIMGQFHHVSKKHLQRYCDEFSFRWNFKDLQDDSRTMMAIRQAEGKRLMYKKPIEKVA